MNRQKVKQKPAGTPKTTRAEQLRAKQQAMMVLRVQGVAYEDWLTDQHRACFDEGFEALARLVDERHDDTTERKEAIGHGEDTGLARMEDDAQG